MDGVVIVSGGRNFREKNYVFQMLTEFHNGLLGPIELLVTGAAKGVDRIALLWAMENEVEFHGMPAKWSQYGKKAGPYRNENMLIEHNPDAVLLFPGGPGTANMKKLANTFKVSHIVEYPNIQKST